MRLIEESVIAGILMSRESLERYLAAANLLSPDDFTSDRCRKAWLTLGSMVSTGEPLSWDMFVARSLDSRGENYFEMVSWVNEMTTDMHIPERVLDHAKVLKAETARRKLRSLLHRVDEFAQTENLTDTAAELRGLADLGADLASDIEDRAVVLDDAALLRRYHEHAQAGTGRALLTGWGAIDRNGGLLPGELVTIVARPKVGKSALAQNLCANVLRRDPDRRVLYFTLEMPVELFAERWKQIVCSATRQWVRENYQSDDALSLLNTVRGIRVTRPQRASLDDIRRDTETTKRREGRLDLVVIDHADFVELPASDMTLADRIRSLYVGLKRLAGDADLPLVVLHQGSRQQGEGTEEPTASSARGSAAPEEVSDLMLGAWRPGMDSSLEGRTLKMKAIVARRMSPFYTELAFDPETLVIRDEEAR